MVAKRRKEVDRLLPKNIKAKLKNMSLQEIWKLKEKLYKDLTDEEIEILLEYFTSESEKDRKILRTKKIAQTGRLTSFWWRIKWLNEEKQKRKRG